MTFERKYKISKNYIVGNNCVLDLDKRNMRVKGMMVLYHCYVLLRYIQQVSAVVHFEVFWFGDDAGGHNSYICVL